MSLNAPRNKKHESSGLKVINTPLRLSFPYCPRLHDYASLLGVSSSTPTCSQGFNEEMQVTFYPLRVRD